MRAQDEVTPPYASPTIVKPFYNGSRVLALNDWKLIEIRATMGDSFSQAVQKMRRAIEQGEMAEAQQAFEESVKLQPNLAPYCEWADTLAARGGPGDLKSAIELYKQVLSNLDVMREGASGAIPPPHWLMRYCLLLLQSGDKDAAIAAYEQGLEVIRHYEFDGLRKLLEVKALGRPVVNTRLLQAAAYTIIGATNLETRTEEEFRMPPLMKVVEYRTALALQPDFVPALLFLIKAHEKMLFCEPGSAEEVAAARQAALRSTDPTARALARKLLNQPD